MSLQLLLKGLTIGFSIAAPVGPIGLLCIRRAVAEGQRAGFICGLGAATADAAYALIGGFAMTALAGSGEALVWPRRRSVPDLSRPAYHGGEQRL